MKQDEKQNEKIKILIVDDLSVNVEILANIIEAEGYEALKALNVQEALDIMNETMPRLILSDITMPGMDGLEFCKLLKSNPRTRDIPFIFITVANSGPEKQTAFSAGAVDFIPKPFERIEVVMRVNNQLNSYRIKQEMQDYNRLMHKMMADQKKQMEKERENVLLALTKIIERRSPCKNHHLERVGQNCRVLAQSLQLVPEFENSITDAFIETIGTASRLHDIGNIVMPDALTDIETVPLEERQETLRRHTEDGARILEEINGDGGNSRFLNMAIVIARYHHAHWDGNGYPENTRGRDIPLAARITAVVNDFDALLVKYQDGTPESVEKCVKTIQERSGTYYDPGVVKVFCKVVKRLQTD